MRAANGAIDSLPMELSERPSIPQWVCGPFFLFSLGFAQAMFPYGYWAWSGINPYYSYDITFQPALIWLHGWCFFCAGAMIAQARKGMSRPSPCDERERVRFQGIVIVFLIISVIGVISVITGIYGGIPILNYFSGVVDVTEVNESQSASLSGQLGFVVACNFTLTMALVAYWRNVQVFNLSRRMLILLVISAVIFQSIMAGKRQGLLMLVCAIGCGFVLSSRRPGIQIANLLGFSKRNRILGLALVAAVIFSVFYSFGYLAAIRNAQGQVEGVDALGTATDQSLTYLQLPLINFEVQTAQSAWGPGTDNPIGPLLNIIPYKIQQNYLGEQTGRSAAPRAESGIGAGFYGDIHWYWGLWGVILFSLIIGYLCQWLYMSAPSNSLSLAIYCQLAWTLVAAHSYNHFFMLVYGILPVGMFLIATFLWGGWKNSPDRARTTV